MIEIDKILQLPKEEQIAIMEAIQENLENSVDDNDELSKEQIEFIRNRIDEIENGQQETYTWDEVKKAIANRWNTK